MLIAQSVWIVFSVLCMNTTGLTAVMIGLMVLFFEGGMLPIIFVISLRGTGHHVKTATCLLETAISGAAFPFANMLP